MLAHPTYQFDNFPIFLRVRVNDLLLKSSCYRQTAVSVYSANDIIILWITTRWHHIRVSINRNRLIEDNYYYYDQTDQTLQFKHSSIMYQTQASLKRKAQGGNLDREEFIFQLTSEFYTSRNPGILWDVKKSFAYYVEVSLTIRENITLSDFSCAWIWDLFSILWGFDLNQISIQR